MKRVIRTKLLLLLGMVMGLFLAIRTARPIIMIYE